MTLLQQNNLIILFFFFLFQRCVPEFGNAAFNVLVDATNTCGMNGRTEYCVQTESSQKYCSACYPPGSPEGETHPPEFLTDFNNERNQTWWQSETMLEGIQYPNQVNLTLHLRKYFYKYLMRANLLIFS